MNKMNLKVYLKLLNGDEAEPVNEQGKPEKVYLSRILANQLAVRSDGIDPLKAYDWALRLWNDHTIEVDDSDLKKLNELVTSHSQLSNLQKAQILKELDKCKLKEASEKK